MAKKVLGKADLVEEILKKHKDMSKKSVTDLVNSVLETVTAQVVKGNDINLVGFGKFSRVKRKARTGRNPATGEEIKIAASNQPKFSAGKSFKDAVNKK